jgi:hypothetical protein
MYARKSAALVAPVKEAFIRREAGHSGLAANGSHGWAATLRNLYVWRAGSGTYADLKALPVPGVEHHLLCQDAMQACIRAHTRNAAKRTLVSIVQTYE